MRKCARFEHIEYMSLQVGNLTIDYPVILAPMSGVTDYPFRSIVKKLGASFASLRNDCKQSYDHANSPEHAKSKSR